MIKGVNRTIIEVSEPTNHYFERALLFVRPKWQGADRSRLQTEANRYVASVGTPPQGSKLSAEARRNRKIKRWFINAFWWGAGVLCGMLSMLLLR